MLAAILAAGGTPATLAPAPAFPRSPIRSLRRAPSGGPPSGEWLRRAAGHQRAASTGVDAAASRAVIAAALAHDDEAWLDPADPQPACAYGLPLVPERDAATPEEAAAAALSSAFPLS